MKWFALLLLWPVSLFAQINPALIVKDNLVFTRLENSGSGMFGFEKGGKYGYIDKTGKEMIAPELDFEIGSTSKSIPLFVKGYAVFKKNRMTGLIDKTGKEIIPAEYYSVTFNAPSSTVTVYKLENSKYVYGLLSLQNKTIIPLQYESIYLDSNLVIVKKAGKYGLLDITGKELLPPDYNSLSASARDKLVVVGKSGSYSLMDLKGTVLFEKPSSVFTLYGISQGLVKCAVNSKYGFLDLKGNEAIITKYDYASEFQSVGLAQVNKKNPNGSYSYSSLYGYVDKRGNEVIPLKYESLGNFKQGLLLVKDPETNRYGFLDKTGKWAIPATFIDASAFTDEGISSVKMTDGKYHCINTAGKDLGIVNEKSSSLPNFLDGLAVQELTNLPYILIDKNGKSLKTIADCAGVYNFSENIAGVKSASTSLYGFVDIQGKSIAPYDYTGFTGFTDGVSRVSKSINNKTKYGYLNNKGELFLPVEYDDVQSFRNNWGLLKKDSNYFFVDKKGGLKEPPRKYNSLLEFRTGFALGKVNGEVNGLNTFYYINPSLKEEFSIQAKEAYLFWDEVAVIRRDTDLELINKKGESIKTLTGIDLLKFPTEGIMPVKKGGKWGFMDIQGNQVTAPIYDSCEQYKYGYAKVRSGSKWGIVDRTGREVIAPKYDNILPGENGIFIYLDVYWGVMDKTGKIIVPPVYYTITPFEKDRALAKSGAKYVIIKSPGK